MNSTERNAKTRTGMPHEHEIPAPVTTTIFLHFATASERFDNVRRVEVSVSDLFKSNVIGGIFGRRGKRQRACSMC